MRLLLIVAGLVGCGSVTGGPDAPPGLVDAPPADAAPPGTRLAALAWGGSGADFGEALAPAPGGDVYLTGVFSGIGVDVAGTTLNAAGGLDTLLARLRPDGTTAWIKGFGGSDNDRIVSIAADASGDVAVAGFFVSPTLVLSTGVSLINQSPGAQDAFVALFAPDGELRWASNVGSDGPGDRALDVAFAADGDVIFVGGLDGTAPFPSGTLTSLGSNDALIGRLRRADGVPTWATSFGGTGGEEAWALVLDEAGPIATAAVVGQTFSDSFAYGAGAPLASGGGFDAFVVSIALGGTGVWAKRLGGPSNEASRKVARRPGGNLLVPFFADQPVDLGPGLGTFTPVGYDGLLLEFTDTGGVVGSVALTGPGEERVTGVWVAPDGTAYASGVYGDGATLGDTTLPTTTATTTDAWLARVDEDRAVTWAFHASASASATFADVAFDAPPGTLRLTGEFFGMVEGPAGPLTAVGDRDGWLLTVAQ